jgi:hypothetical protein
MRLWRDDDEYELDAENERHDSGQGRTAWRASLEGALSGKRHGFASLDALFTFLRRETGIICDEEGDE